MSETKINFRKALKAFYGTTARDFEIVTVPRMQFLMVDGRGDPNTSAEYAAGLGWLYPLSYALKFASKAGGRDYTVPPLEALWWAEDMGAFVAGSKDEWLWTQMIMVPEWLSAPQFADALERTRTKLGAEPPASLRLEPFEEGLSVQVLHIGPYDAEAPTIARLHQEFLPANGLVENGHHHEIYLSDPRKTAPDKLRTILRQPVRPA